MSDAQVKTMIEATCLTTKFLRKSIDIELATIYITDLKNLRRLSVSISKEVEQLCEVLKSPNCLIDHLEVQSYGKHAKCFASLFKSKKNFVNIFLNLYDGICDYEESFELENSIAGHKRLTSFGLMLFKGCGDTICNVTESLPNLKVLEYYTDSLTNCARFFNIRHLKKLIVRRLSRADIDEGIMTNDEVTALNNNTSLKELFITSISTTQALPLSNIIFNGSILDGTFTFLNYKNTRMHDRVRKMVCDLILAFPLNKTLRRIHKDVFTLILRMVYDSRTDWRIWEPSRATGLSDYTDPYLF
jgi:hypothetical protein